MDRPHLLMIGGWKALIDKAVKAGYDVSFLGDTHDSEWQDGTLERDCVQACHAAVVQISTCLVHARRMHAQRPFDAVVSFTEFGLETAAVVADALGVKGLGLHPVAVTRYKDRMRAVLDAHPDLALRWRLVHNGAELRDFWQEHGPDLILKPAAGVGSEGVYEINGARDLEETAENPAWQGDTPYLAERFVPGDGLYSVETVTAGGEHRTVAVTLAKLVGDPKTVVNYIMTPPPPPHDVHAKRVAAAAHRLLDAIELGWGVAHTEVKVDTDGQPVIIESQTRVGGHGISRMVEWSTGTLQLDAALTALCADAPGFPATPVVPVEPPAGQVTVSFSILPPAGRVKAVADPKVLDTVPEVLDHEIRITPGCELVETVDNSARQGMVWLRAGSHDEVFAAMRAVCDNYWVEYDDGHIWHPSY
ncbi:ATP-grasp domain-containing protein [Streptomyces sp. NPDC003042]